MVILQIQNVMDIFYFYIVDGTFYLDGVSAAAKGNGYGYDEKSIECNYIIFDGNGDTI